MIMWLLVLSTDECVVFNCVSDQLLTYTFAEIARDSLHSTGRFTVVGGIISPVSDQYSRKVSYRLL